MDKICITTPKAPVKYKKQIKKGGLRPKKLHYTDDELDAIDSGVYIQCNQSNDMFHKQRMAKCNRFDSSQSQIHRLRVKLDKIKVQTNDKENDKNIIGNNKNNVVQESSVGRSTKSEKIYMHVSKTKNIDTKGKLVHFRV